MITRSFIHHLLYLLGMIALAISIPLSHFAMGLTAFILLLNAVAEWNWKERFERLRNNKGGIVLASLFFFCCLGLIKTNDWATASHNLLAKLPILFAPLLVASSKPFSHKEFRWIQGCFIGSTLFCCIFSFCFWLTHSVQDMREISVFIDHIRFSLCIVVSILFCVNIMVQDNRRNMLSSVLCPILILAQLLYMFLSQTLTGIIILFTIGILYGVYLIFTMPKCTLRTGLLASIVVITVSITGYTGIITYRYFHDSDKEIQSTHTALGNEYTFDETSLIENGHRIDYYVCRPELQTAWQMRSDSSYTDLLEQTLIRYLNSKGMHKDYAAVMQLSKQDVRHIENQIANVEYTRNIGLQRALYQTYFSYSMFRKYGFIEQSSLYQRFELWNASWNVIRKNCLWGVGIGDYKAELDKQLERQGSSIAHKHNRGSHNQFITFWMMGGLVLVLAFLGILFYPFFKMKNRITFLYVAFFIMMFLSMLAEDTIESQPGRMLFAIFTPLLLFSEMKRKKD